MSSAVMSATKVAMSARPGSGTVSVFSSVVQYIVGNLATSYIAVVSSSFGPGSFSAWQVPFVVISFQSIPPSVAVAHRSGVCFLVVSYI